MAEGPHLNNIQLTLVLVVQQQLDKVFYRIAGDWARGLEALSLLQHYLESTGLINKEKTLNLSISTSQQTNSARHRNYLLSYP